MICEESGEWIITHGNTTVQSRDYYRSLCRNHISGESAGPKKRISASQNAYPDQKLIVKLKMVEINARTKKMAADENTSLTNKMRS